MEKQTPADLDQVKADLSLIRNLLTAGDSKFPLNWVLLPVMGLIVAAASLALYFWPGAAALTADQLLPVFWLPLFSALFLVGFTFYFFRVRAQGHIVLVGPLRDLFFARYFIGPVTFFFLWLLRHEPLITPLILMGLSVLMGMITFVMPKAFRLIPTATLLLAAAEFALGWSTAETALVNGLYLAAAFTVAGLIVKKSGAQGV